MEIPGGELAVFGHAGADVDDAGWGEVGPREFPLAGPDNFYGFASGFCQAGGFDRGIDGVLAAVTGAGIGDDDANFVVGQIEGAGEVGADTEGLLGSGPDGELAILPLGDADAGLER